MGSLTVRIVTVLAFSRGTPTSWSLLKVPTAAASGNWRFTQAAQRTTLIRRSCAPRDVAFRYG
jgi:hypothetical protein